MARFCTQCAHPAAPDALFCEECGAPLRRTAPAASDAATEAASVPSASARRISKKGLVLASTAAALLVAAAAGAAWWLAPESATASTFARAVTAYYETNAKARDDLLCVSNLPYAKESLRIGQYDQRTRNWLDALANAGLYTATVEEQQSGWFSQKHYVYAVTETGKQAIRNNQLCLGDALVVQSASGFDQVHEHSGTKYAQANVKLALKEAAWLAKADKREDILQQAGKANLSANVPVMLADGKWKVPDDPTRIVRQMRLAQATVAASNTDSGGLLAAVKGMFTANPVIGKWSIEGSGEQMEFTSNAYIQNGETIPVNYVVNGDVVQVKPTGHGNGFQLKMSGKDVAVIENMVRLERVK
ncbi:hypothetical protein EDC30_111104 [Paucimonas lemoignei]|uniref:Uncharacterized protein n=1 Tax=Paucimonas lemoignei TaxID=29443 RepID=A0A4R3HTP0_PAULE|nr:zinc ribbon domain-containing protein [Paucimonas lemoignei]TCS35189.1 hypothetical protein EDC30_111104 [Paucimonas lemoignei]